MLLYAGLSGNWSILIYVRFEINFNILANNLLDNFFLQEEKYYFDGLNIVVCHHNTVTYKMR